MPRYLSALVFGFIVTAALAGDDDPVKQPFVEVGDCWTYRKSSDSVKDKFGRLVHDFTSCITYVDYSKDVILTVSSSGGDGTDQTFTAEWNPVTNSHTVLSSKTKYLQFPLHVGDTYSFDADYQVVDNEKHQTGTRRWFMKVVGWEDVTVPAGTFRAMRIEGVGIQKRSENRRTIWYAPEVNREVKTIVVRHSSGTIVHELTQYRLNK